MKHVQSHRLLQELRSAGLIKFNPATLSVSRSITGKLRVNYSVEKVYPVFTYKGFIYEVKQQSFNYPFFVYQS